MAGLARIRTHRAPGQRELTSVVKDHRKLVSRPRSQAILKPANVRTNLEILADVCSRYVCWENEGAGLLPLLANGAGACGQRPVIRKLPAGTDRRGSKEP
jgi:hypothetical protein